MTSHDRKHPLATDDSADTEINDERRAVLKSVAKYAAFMAGTSVVLMTPEQALANQNCSTHPNPKPGQNCT